MKIITIALLAFLIIIEIQAQTDTSEFQNFFKGEKEVFLSEGLLKAKGLKLRMEYPKAWSAREGKRPQVLQFFKSPELFEMASISMMQISKLYDGTVEELEYYSKEIADELLSDTMMKSTLKLNDDVLIEEYEYFKTRISNLDAVFSSCKITTPGNADIGDIRMYSQIYMLIYKDFYVIIHYMIQQHSNESENQFNSRIKEYIPLLKLMANSIILLNQYD